MTPRLRSPRSLAAGLAAVLALGGCELALHEVQQATADGCDPWQAGCAAVVEHAGDGPVPSPRIDVGRAQIVSAAIEAPYRPCDGVGLVCQGRIIGDVLWDEYLMVLAGRSDAAASAASAQRAVPAAGSRTLQPAAAAAVPASAQPEPEPAAGRIVRTHGSRAGEATTAAPPR
jgi:hypothetical protein